MLNDPLRGGDLLEENDCITTVPEWREGGHVRGGGPSPCSLVVYRRMRERQRGTFEGQESVGQIHTTQVFLIVAESL